MSYPHPQEEPEKMVSGHGGKIADRGLFVPPSPFVGFGRFGRMFPHLGPHEVSAELLLHLGRPDGEMDEGDGKEKADGAIPAGMTFVGQFIDHDVTLDTTSSLERQNDPTAIHNFRTPYLELDSVYGSGPDATPFLYDQRTGQRGELLIGFKKDKAGKDTDEPSGDLPRNSQDRALIGDPRNDENVILAQLHLAFLNFHNAVLRDLRSKNAKGDPFLKAQEQVRWHYQWMVVHEFLPSVCDPKIVKDILANGRRYFRFESEAQGQQQEPFMPVEFAVAAFRFGHSLVRNRYRMNNTSGDLPLFSRDQNQPSLGTGFKPIPPEYLADWGLFFEIDGSRPQKSRRFDIKLAHVLFDLPFIPQAAPPTSLAARNLLRGRQFALPSGEAVAKTMGIDPKDVLTRDELGIDGIEAGGEKLERTPLWFYILREADVKASGEHLGPVGSYLVAETIIGMLQGDSRSYLTRDPLFEPCYGSNEDFKMADLIKFSQTAQATRSAR